MQREIEMEGENYLGYTADPGCSRSQFFFLWVLGMEREEKFYFIHFMIFYFKKKWKEREKNSYICLKIIILKRNK